MDLKFCFYVFYIVRDQYWWDHNNSILQLINFNQLQKKRSHRSDLDSIILSLSVISNGIILILDNQTRSHSEWLKQFRFFWLPKYELVHRYKIQMIAWFLVKSLKQMDDRYSYVMSSWSPLISTFAVAFKLSTHFCGFFHPESIYQKQQSKKKYLPVFCSIS